MQLCDVSRVPCDGLCGATSAAPCPITPRRAGAALFSSMAPHDSSLGLLSLPTDVLPCIADKLDALRDRRVFYAASWVQPPRPVHRHRVLCVDTASCVWTPRPVHRRRVLCIDTASCA